LCGQAIGIAPQARLGLAVDGHHRHDEVALLDPAPIDLAAVVFALSSLAHDVALALPKPDGFAHIKRLA
jgi:hypothetical protein